MYVCVDFKYVCVDFKYVCVDQIRLHMMIQYTPQDEYLVAISKSGQNTIVN